jgi:SAM-dependent methyltransferase
VGRPHELVALQDTLYKSRNPTRRWLHLSRREYIMDAVRRYTPKDGGKALEVGPGSGVYLPVLSGLFKEVVAVDIEVAYLKYLQRLVLSLHNVRLVMDDIRNSGLINSSFDLILCSEVVEHIRESTLAIHEMYRLLKPNGILILSTPQRWSVMEVTAAIALLPGVIDLVRLVYREPILEMGHVNLLTEGDITSSLEEAGFRIVEKAKSGMYVPILAEFAGRFGLWLERRLESKLRGGLLDCLLWTQYYIAETRKAGI